MENMANLLFPIQQCMLEFAFSCFLPEASGTESNIQKTRPPVFVTGGRAEQNLVQLSEVLDGADHLRGVAVLVVARRKRRAGLLKHFNHLHPARIRHTHDNISQVFGK